MVGKALKLLVFCGLVTPGVCACAIQTAPADERAGAVEVARSTARPSVEVISVGAPEIAKGPADRSAYLLAGRCITQDDCGFDSVCVAVAPGHASCLKDAGYQPLVRAPNGRPAPPVGLLDGQVLRDHVRGGRP